MRYELTYESLSDVGAQAVKQIKKHASMSARKKSAAVVARKTPRPFKAGGGRQKRTPTGTASYVPSLTFPRYVIRPDDWRQSLENIWGYLRMRGL